MSDKLGFTFYPKDWWTSDTFFEFDEFERYLYLECIFLMYQGNGYLTLKKEQVESRLRTQIKPKIWEKITQQFEKKDLGYTLESVNKRLKRANSSRENGKKGGRPKKPKKPSEETQKNPPLEREREKEIEKEILNSKNWLETIAMQKKVLDIDKKIVLFLDEQKLLVGEGNGFNRDIDEIKNHFVKWVSYNFKNEEPTNPKIRQPQKAVWNPETKQYDLV